MNHAVIKKCILFFLIFFIWERIYAQTSHSNQPENGISLFDLLNNGFGMTEEQDSINPAMLRIAILSHNYEQADKMITDRPELITSRDFEGDTPLLIACLAEDVRLIQLFIDKGADIDEVNDEKQSCLSLLIYKGVQEGINAKIIYVIENFNPNIQVKDKDGDTPFLLACFQGNMEITEYFLDEKGVDINQKNDHKNTCMHYLAAGGSEEKIRQLSNRDPQPDHTIVNNDGQTPADILLVRQAFISLFEGLFGEHFGEPHEGPLGESSCPVEDDDEPKTESI